MVLLLRRDLVQDQRILINEDILLSPPGFLYLRSNSPVEGAVDTAEEIIAIVKSVDAIFRNRTIDENPENDKTGHNDSTSQTIELKKRTDFFEGIVRFCCRFNSKCQRGVW
jgi:hypothetical protein